MTTAGFQVAVRVAIVNEHVESWRGGAEKATFEMARQLDELGFDVTIVTSADGNEDATDPPGMAMRYVRVEGVTRAARTRSFVYGADEMCQGERFDLVHAITPCFSADVYQPRGGTYRETMIRSLDVGQPFAIRAIRRFGARFNARRNFLMQLEERMLRSREAPVVAAVSDYVRRQIRGNLDFPPQRVQVIFNGVDIQPLGPEEAAVARDQLRRKFEVADSAPVVAFIAHNFKLKGLASLLYSAAAGEGRAAGWHLLVAGRDDFAPYARLARRLGIADRVKHVGAVSDSRHLYAAADCLAHPTWYDPCSRVVLEALCVGLPVVTTQLNGAAEIMHPPTHGAVIDSPSNIPELESAIRRCLRLETRHACEAQAAGMRERLSMTRHARELAELYRDVLSTRAKPAAQIKVS